MPMLKYIANTIPLTQTGSGGFGYDPVFVPAEGDGRTFAEMGDEIRGVDDELYAVARTFFG